MKKSDIKAIGDHKKTSIYFRISRCKTHCSLEKTMYKSAISSKTLHATPAIDKYVNNFPTETLLNLLFYSAVASVTTDNFKHNFKHRVQHVLTKCVIRLTRAA